MHCLRCKPASQNRTLPPCHQQIEAETGEEFDFLLADARFDLATRIAREVTHERGKISRTLSDKLDRWVLGKLDGHPHLFGDDVPVIFVQHQSRRGIH